MKAPMSDRRIRSRSSRPGPQCAAFLGAWFVTIPAFAGAQAPPSTSTGPTPGALLLAVLAAALVAALLCVLLVQRRALRAVRANLRCREDELAHATRLTAAGELSASIAHEINQPLGAILANADAAEMLLSKPHVPVAELRRILTDIRADDLRAHEVIRRLRGLLERREAERRPLDVHVAIADAMAVLAAEARRRGVEFAIRHAATRSGMLGDRVQLQQVMLNLLLNAMDASCDVPPTKRRVLVDTTDDEGFVVVRVRDRGRGFHPHAADALFASFYSTKPGGLGLGLSIARAIVDAHQGTIAAAPRTGGGAEFTLRLPCLAVAPAPARTRSPATATTPARSAALA